MQGRSLLTFTHLALMFVLNAVWVLWSGSFRKQTLACARPHTGMRVRKCVLERDDGDCFFDNEFSFGLGLVWVIVFCNVNVHIHVGTAFDSLTFTLDTWREHQSGSLFLQCQH
jgi:hypothetical protein